MSGLPGVGEAACQEGMAVKARNHSRVASALPHSEGIAYKPPCGEVAMCRRVGRMGPLNAPWGIAQAPGDFGAFSHRLLIGNFGDGFINAYNAVSGKRVGTLLDASGAPIWIDGLWALSFGGGNANSGLFNDLYFTAGPNDEKDGLFGKLTPVASDQRGNSE